MQSLAKVLAYRLPKSIRMGVYHFPMVLIIMKESCGLPLSTQGIKCYYIQTLTMLGTLSN